MLSSSSTATDDDDDDDDDDYDDEEEEDEEEDEEEFFSFLCSWISLSLSFFLYFSFLLSCFLVLQYFFQPISCMHMKKVGQGVVK